MATKKIAPKAAAPKKAAPAKKKVVAKVKPAPADKKSDLQQQLAGLHAQMAALNQEAVGELKLKINDTKKVLRGYELQLETLTGKAATKLKGR